MMNLEEALKIGFLLIPPQSFLRKTWLKRYCAIYSSSNHGIQRIELFESEDAFVKQNPSKIIPLTDCIKVSPAPQKQQPNVFEVRTKDNAYQFSAETFQDMSEWLTCFQTVAFGKNLPKVPSSNPMTKEEKQEENMLYSSMNEPEIYSVKAMPTEATLRNELIGDYKLIVTPVNLSIAEEYAHGRMGRIILTWPYRHIRRYGCTTENFSFEAGRKCTSGEGLFTFSTNDGMLIFQSVDSHVFALKSSQNEFEIPSSPSLNEDKNFFTSKDSLANRKDSASYSVSKLDKSRYAMLGNDNESLPFQNKAFTVKSVAPLAKPPRKSKSNKDAYLYRSVNPTSVKDIPNEDSQFSTNVYEELYKRTTSECSHQNSNLSSVSHQIHDNSEQMNLSVADEKISRYDTKKLEVCDTPKKGDPVAKLDYENCDFFQRNSAVPKTADHIYGKLLNTRQELSSNDGSHTYGTIFPRQSSSSESASSPVYSNIQCFQKSYDNINASDNIQRDPEHFVKNDAEYAQVFKKNDIF